MSAENPAQTEQTDKVAFRVSEGEATVYQRLALEASEPGNLVTVSDLARCALREWVQTAGDDKLEELAERGDLHGGPRP